MTMSKQYEHGDTSEREEHSDHGLALEGKTRSSLVSTVSLSSPPAALGARVEEWSSWRTLPRLAIGRDFCAFAENTKRTFEK